MIFIESRINLRRYFFFNDTANTEIYTLSLHDALPISMPFILTRPKVPNLNVAGWWDQEDFYGPMKIYEILEKEDPDHLNYLVTGPWNHGGWAHGAGDRKSTRLNSSHVEISYAVFCLKK